MMQADPAEIRDKADDILSKPEYTVEGPGPIQRLFDRLNEWLAEVAGSLFGGAGGAPVIGWIVVVVLVALIGWFLVRVLPRRAPRSQTKQALVDHEQRVRDTRKQWLERAASAEAKGAWTDAIHARYRAMIAGLLEDKLVSGDEGATSGEYAASFTGQPNRNEGLREATDRFEDVWYGGQDAGTSDSQRLQALDGTVLHGQAADRSHEGTGR